MNLKEKIKKQDENKIKDIGRKYKEILNLKKQRAYHKENFEKKQAKQVVR